MEKQTLGEIAAQSLVQMIREKRYVPGDKLPTEMELSEVLGVGRNTVREALRILMSRNIVTIRQGAGTFMSEKNGIPDDPLGFFMVNDTEKLTRDLMQMRMILEPPIAALAAQNATEEEIIELERIFLEIERLVYEHKDYAKQDSKFHAWIAICSHNEVISNLVPVITEGIRVFASSVKVTEYEQTLVSHRAIFEAIQGRKALEAQQAMAFHLMYNENRYVRELSEE